MDIMTDVLKNLNSQLQQKCEKETEFKQSKELALAINSLKTHPVQTKENMELPPRVLSFDEINEMFGSPKSVKVLGNFKKPSEERKKSTDKNEILKKIEMILEDVNKKDEMGEVPKLTIRNQKLWSNCIYDFDRVTLKSVIEAKKSVVTYSASRDKSKFNAIIFVLTRIHELVTRNLTCTRRELYYQNLSRLKNQTILDTAVRDVCCLLESPPWELGVCATAKGLIAGPLTIVTKEGVTVDFMKKGGVLIPQDVVNIHSIKSTAKYILVVEKDAIFQKLLDEDILIRLGPVGKGYPDICTRQLLVRLMQELNLPAFAIVDYDPHGYEIFLTYKFGSLAQSHISESLCATNLRLFGLLGADVRILAGNNDKAPLNEKDKRKLMYLLVRPYLQTAQYKGIRAEIEKMLDNGFKAEIECVATLTTAYMTDSYIPNKIKHHDFI